MRSAKLGNHLKRKCLRLQREKWITKLRTTGENTLDYMNLDKNITWSGKTEKGIVKSIIFIYALVTTVILDKLPTIAGCSCSSFSSFFISAAVSFSKTVTMKEITSAKMLFRTFFSNKYY